MNPIPISKIFYTTFNSDIKKVFVIFCQFKDVKNNLNACLKEGFG